MFNFRKMPLTSSLVERFITSANVGAAVRNQIKGRNLAVENFSPHKISPLDGIREIFF